MMKSQSNRCLVGVSSQLLLAALAANAATNQPAGPTPAPAPAKVTSSKPAWITELSLGVKEGYDNNVLQVSGDGPTEKQDSWITAVSAKAGLNLLPLTGGTNLFQTLTFAYNPDFVSYHNATDESYNIHRLVNALKGKSGDFSYSLDNAFHFVDGNHDAAVYLGADSARSAYATATSRERKYQWQERAKINLQYDLSSFFFRPNATLLYYELLTHQNVPLPPGSPAGSAYQNYADRYDVNGGIDIGYKLNKKVSLFVGYRYGHQFQEQYEWDATLQSSPSDYQRALIGIEGKPLKWLTLNVMGGPDFRNYEDNSATHITPVDDPELLTYYVEGNITADAGPNDSFNIRYRGWQWVSSTGRIPYFDSKFDLVYRHKFGKKLTLDAGGGVNNSDYNSANVAAGNRNDWMFQALGGLNYALAPNAALSLNYLGSFGRNGEDNVANGPFREFDNHVISLGAQLKF